MAESQAQILAERARLARIRHASAQRASGDGSGGWQGVYDVYRTLSPKLSEPRWLHPYVTKLDGAIGAGEEFCFAAPPQHGKTEALLHALIYWSAAFPGKRHAYSTFNFRRALRILKKVKRMAFEAGLDPHSSDGLLTLSGGTEIMFGGCQAGTLTGSPIDGVHAIDDPIEDRIQAESEVTRNNVWEWFTDVAETRRHPGSSVLVMMTRWHPDDLIGRLIKHKKWPYIRIPAVCDSEDDLLGRQIGEVLWSAMRPASFLQKFQVNAYTWASMYQGLPRPRGDSLFGEPHFYKRIPDSAFIQGHGVDFAYTAKTRADFSVMLSGQKYGPEIYAVDLLRDQKQAPVFTGMMKKQWEKLGSKGKLLWLCSGTEKGVAQFVKEKVPNFIYAIAAADKYVRATPFADNFWNCGKFLLPDTTTRKTPWLDEYIEEMCTFSGVEDAQDDQVDASAALGALMRTVHTGIKELNAAIRGAA